MPERDSAASPHAQRPSASLRHLSTMLSIERSIVPNTEFIRAEVFSLFLAIAVSAGALHATARSEGLLNFQVGYEAHIATQTRRTDDAVKRRRLL